MSVTESTQNRKAACSGNRDRTRKRLLCWLLWWQVGEIELQRQVENYRTLGLIGSARGLSLVAAILTGAGWWFLAAVFITHGLQGRLREVVALVDSVLLVEGFLFFSLGRLAYRGKPLAMIGLMALWTISMAWFDIWCIQYHLLALSFYVHPVRTSVPLVITLLGWPVGMHAFYLARRVERARTSTA